MPVSAPAKKAHHKSNDRVPALVKETRHESEDRVPVPVPAKDKQHKSKVPAPAVAVYTVMAARGSSPWVSEGSTELIKPALALFIAPVPAGGLTHSHLTGDPHHGAGLTEPVPLLFTVLAPLLTDVG